MTTVRLTSDIAAELHNAPNGATVPTVVGVTVPTVGYVVAVHGHGVILTEAETTAEAVEAWVTSVIRHTASPGRYVGSWHYDGSLYLDVVETCSERATATAKARLWSEVAIYDLANKADITV